MISQTDLQGRLRLLRYGLVVVVVVTFLVALLAPYAVAAPWAAELNKVADALEQAGGTDVPKASVQIADFLGTAVLYAIIVAVLAVIVYFVYQNVLQRTVQSP
jgi:predicted PurR-regulated permease PerM